MLWLSLFCALMALIIAMLVIKIALVHKAAEEIHAELAERLDTDTNTLITVSCGDRQIRRLAADLNGQLRLLQQERRQLQNGDRELKEAVTNISHDLRTPLTAICGYLDLLKQEKKTEAVGRYLAVIENRTEAMKQLMEELFSYSVITSATHDMHYEDVALNSVLEESISTYYAVLKNRGITPVISIPERPVHRRLDRRALARIFGNVLDNAAKYSDGYLEISLSESGEIDFINGTSQLNEVQVGKLFDRFYTVEAGRKSTGLGLSIARSLTEQLNGEICAHYSNGKLNIHIVFAIQ